MTGESPVMRQAGHKPAAKTKKEVIFMTIIERVKQALKNYDGEKDSLDKVIVIAYFIGREAAAKEISDKAREIFAEQQKRAKASRYHNFAMNVQGNVNYIYSPDYAGEMTSCFGTDETEI